MGSALQTLGLLGQREAGLELSDRALETIGDLPDTVDLRVSMLTNRAYNLEALGRFEPAEAAMREALIVAEQAGSWRLPTVRVQTAGQLIDVGQWDDAWVELESMSGDLGLVERLVTCGGIAFITAHRDQRAACEEQLRIAASLPTLTGYLRASGTLLIMARAVDAEQRSGPASAAEVLADTLDLDDVGDLYERYLWLPDLVRLPLADGDNDLARAAVAAAEADAATEPLPPRIPAARRAPGGRGGEPAGRLLPPPAYIAG